MSWMFQRQRDFTGGENRLVLPEFMKPNQLILAQNCIITPDGVPETRKGKKAINATSLGTGKVISVHRYAKANGNKYLVVQHSTSLYSAPWDGVSIISSFTTIKTGLSGAKLRSKPWKDQLIFGDGVVNNFRFDGTTCTDLAGTPPKFAIFCIYAGRIWCVDVATGYVRFSGLETYDTWDALDVIRVRDADGDSITGLSPQNGGLIITKNKSVWPLFGTSRFDMRLATAPLVDSVGCVATDCLVDAGVMLGKNSLFRFSLSGLEPAGETHRPIIETLTDTERAASFAQVVPKESRVVMVLGSGAVLSLDGKNNCITSWAGLNAGCLGVADANGDNGALLIGDATNGWVYALTNEVDDAGVAISTVIRTPPADHGVIRKKAWRLFRPEIEPKNGVSGALYLQYDVDYATQIGIYGINKSIPDILDFGVDRWGEAVWGSKIKINEPYWLHGVRGDTISFTITTTDRIKLTGYTIKYREAGAL